jgi:ABC-type glycerol-3-phosphate transport system substrate-binding protein
MRVDESESYPLAQELGFYGTQRIGIPLALDVQHLVYDTNDVLRPPVSWRAILGGRAHYLFPAAGRGDALDALLIQYAMVGGDLADPGEELTPGLRESPLVTALARYQGMRLAGVVAPEALQVDSVAACWPLYLANRASISQVWASDYLARRRMLQRTRYAPVPTSNGTAMTVGRGWLMVLTTRDPDRRESAARLVDWWRSPASSALLCEATGWLPPDRESFGLWGSEDPYYAFLEQQLEGAKPQPTLSSSLADGLSEAIGQVLNGELTAQEAAAQVIAGTNP